MPSAAQTPSTLQQSSHRSLWPSTRRSESERGGCAAPSPMRAAKALLLVVPLVVACHHPKVASAANVQARVVSVGPSLESPLYATATIAFTNRSSERLAIRQYCVAWPGGQMTFDPEELVVPPDGGTTRTARIATGDFAALLEHPEAARVTLAACSEP